jgi:alcohol dehydrogenase class IV
VLKSCEPAEYQLYDEVIENPLDYIVDNGYEKARGFNADVIVGIGGGSALDTATGIAMLMTNGGKAIDYFKGAEIKNVSLPFILIPTTSGTGSEVNRCFVVTDPTNHFKDGIADDLMCPGFTVLDPELTVSMPQKVTASTGIDAFTHAFEAYLSRNANPVSDALNLHAMKLIAENIRTAYCDPENLEARSSMLLASAIAGIGFDQVGLVLAHAMAHPLSGLHNIPHGVSCAVMTAPVMEFNRTVVPGKLVEVGRILGVQADDRLPLYEQAGAAIDGFRRLIADLGLPLTISELGIKEEDLPALVEDAFASPGMRGRNPRVNSKEDILKIYKSLL